MSATKPEGWPPNGSPRSAYVEFWKRKLAVDLAEALVRHERVCAGLDGILLRVAQHHHPIEGTSAVLCAGCDFEREDAILDWPCPTWDLIDPGGDS